MWRSWYQNDFISEYMSLESKWEDANEKVMGSCDRGEGRICAKK